MAESWRVVLLSQYQEDMVKTKHWLFRSKARAVEHIQELLLKSGAHWGISPDELKADPQELAKSWLDITSGSEWIELSRVDSTI